MNHGSLKNMPNISVFKSVNNAHLMSKKKRVGLQNGLVGNFADTERLEINLELYLVLDCSIGTRNYTPN